MIVTHNYIIALICCIYCCICWGSWANTQKLVAQKSWRSELFYWDYILGFFITALVGALTLGTLGGGHTFMQDLSHLDWTSAGYAMLGGVIWNFANVFLTLAIAVAGMSVGFPIGGGLGWIGGVVFNYLLIILAGQVYPGNSLLLWFGIAIVVVAIILCGKAYGKLSSSEHTTPAKGIILALVSGIGFMFFYGLVVKSIDPSLVAGGTGSFEPYTGIFFFAVGVVLTTPIFNGFAMRHPVQGEPVKMRDYLKGDLRTHLIGMFGGFIWMSGMLVSFMGAGAANPAISYALSNASPVVAMIWGAFIWKEFKNAPKGTMRIVNTMFALFVIGLVIVTLSNN